MHQTPMIKRARNIARKQWGDKPDKTGHPRMDSLDRIVEQIDDSINGEYIASIIYAQDLCQYGKKTPLELIQSGLPLRVAYAASRIVQRDNESLEDYLTRIADDRELVLPASLAYAAYMREPDNYQTDKETARIQTMFYATMYCVLKLERGD